MKVAGGPLIVEELADTPSSATGTRRPTKTGEKRGTSDRFALVFAKP